MDSAESTIVNKTNLVNSCVIKKFSNNDTLNTEYLCDTDSLCGKHVGANATGGIMVTEQAVYMKLYCCNTDGCNSPDQANSLPFVETSCMQGMLSISAPAAHTLVSRKCQSEMCVSKSGSVSRNTSYDCDTEHYCVLNHVQHCNSSQGQTICCCKGENCNYQPSPVKPDATLAPMPGVHPTDVSPTQGIVQLNWMFIGALLGALVLSSLVLVLAVIVFRRCRQHRALSLQAEFSYQQLTADLSTEDQSSDDKLLLA